MASLAPTEAAAPAIPSAPVSVSATPAQPRKRRAVAAPEGNTGVVVHTGDALEVPPAESGVTTAPLHAVPAPSNGILPAAAPERCAPPARLPELAAPLHFGGPMPPKMGLLLAGVQGWFAHPSVNPAARAAAKQPLTSTSFHVILQTIRYSARVLVERLGPQTGRRFLPLLHACMNCFELDAQSTEERATALVLAHAMAEIRPEPRLHEVLLGLADTYISPEGDSVEIEGFLDELGLVFLSQCIRFAWPSTLS